MILAKHNKYYSRTERWYGELTQTSVLVCACRNIFGRTRIWVVDKNPSTANLLHKLSAQNDGVW